MKRNTKIQQLRNTRGITLIALVITIIVLLILAGVSIAMLTGQNGILTKANEAKTRTEQAEIEEKRKLTQAEAAMNFETKKQKDADGTEVTVPAKFAISQIEGENKVSEGLVIISEKGNEFVWIPCTVEEYNTTRTSEWLTKQYQYDEHKPWTDSQTATGTTSLENLAKKDLPVGFYVSKYEAGIPENATGIYVNTDGGTYTKEELKNLDTTIEKYTPVSKQNVQAWNYISQKNAKKLAEKMENNSYLIDGNAWDTVCRKISSTGKNVLDSTEWGNYYNNTTTAYEKLNTLYAVHNRTTWTSAKTYNKGQVTGAPKNSGDNMLELATGASEDFKAYNIYDIAGNMWEWTTETTNPEDGYAVLRGGGFSSNGSDYPAVCSNGSAGVAVCNIFIGFRVVLYL